jgi:hypothetical protein
VEGIFRLSQISDQHLYLSIYSSDNLVSRLAFSGLRKMKTNQELLEELLQVSQEYQKNLTKLLEHRELLGHHLSVGKKK